MPSSKPAAADITKYFFKTLIEELRADAVLPAIERHFQTPAQWTCLAADVLECVANGEKYTQLIDRRNWKIPQIRAVQAIQDAAFEGEAIDWTSAISIASRKLRLSRRTVRRHWLNWHSFQGRTEESYLFPASDGLSCFRHERRKSRK
jgi:hypothetical protein